MGPEYGRYLISRSTIPPKVVQVNQKFYTSSIYKSCYPEKIIKISYFTTFRSKRIQIVFFFFSFICMCYVRLNEQNTFFVKIGLFILSQVDNSFYTIRIYFITALLICIIHPAVILYVVPFCCTSYIIQLNHVLTINFFLRC